MYLQVWVGFGCSVCVCEGGGIRLEFMTVSMYNAVCTVSACSNFIYHLLSFVHDNFCIKFLAMYVPLCFLLSILF